MLFRPKTTVLVHSGTFHTDDVFAVASLSLLLEGKDPAVVGKKIHIVRTRDMAQIDAADYVADVGLVYDQEKNRFDHHQVEGAGQRSNGIPYASFGLVWKKFGEKICGSVTVAARVEENLVQAVDAADNGKELCAPVMEDVRPYMLHDATMSLNPTWKEEKNDADTVAYAAFIEAVHFAKKILSREIEKAHAAEEAAIFVKKAYDTSSDKRLIILDDGYPWTREILTHPEPLFVVFPATVGWHVRAVPVKRGGFEVRKDLPKAWAGKNGKEFQEISGVADAVFAHRNLFLCGAMSREGAIALAKKALE